MQATSTRTLATLSVVLTAALGTATAQPARSRTIDNDHRLFQRFIEDGAVVENIWMEAQFRVQSFEDSDVLSITPLLAGSFAEDFEVGGRIGIVSVDPEISGSERGFSDLDLWGKIRLTTKPTQFSVGLLFEMPTGDEDKSLRLGSGELNVGFFGGLRHDFESASLVANAILRVNQDPDVDDPDVLRALGLPGQREPEGETSVGVGGALLFSMTPRVSGILEATYETERIDNFGADFRVTLGGDFRSTDILGIRMGVTAGAGDAAPDYELIGSVYLLF